MKMNSNKCHLLVLGDKFKHMWANIDDDKLQDSRTVGFAGITIDK